ncbi:hypothetical protein EUX57_15665 [Pseudomonas orientalis]|uniref:Uncharacterized protein n=1 Tax=Pseudomonas orientalis TaxID=76758 RepID=A0A4Q7CZD9_9PSED|nr:hypothetical protein EUX57_15665 [Pseudomonas orientalis]
MLAKNSQAPRLFRTHALSLTFFASKLAPTRGDIRLTERLTLKAGFFHLNAQARLSATCGGVDLFELFQIPWLALGTVPVDETPLPRLQLELPGLHIAADHQHILVAPNAHIHIIEIHQLIFSDENTVGITRTTGQVGPLRLQYSDIPVLTHDVHRTNGFFNQGVIGIGAYGHRFEPGHLAHRIRVRSPYFVVQRQCH